MFSLALRDEAQLLPACLWEEPPQHDIGRRPFQRSDCLEPSVEVAKTRNQVKTCECHVKRNNRLQLESFTAWECL